MNSSHSTQDVPGPRRTRHSGVLIHRDVVSFFQLSLDDSIEDQVWVMASKPIGGLFSTRTAVKRVVGVVLNGYFIQRECIVLRLVAVCAAWKLLACH